MVHNTNQDNQEFQVNQDKSNQSGEPKEGGGLQPPASLLQAALDYANEGWAVLPIHSAAQGNCSCGKDPCASPGKHPRTPHGVKEATKETALIQQWWAQWPNANIGLATGKVSGRVVLDVDLKKGKPGDQSLRALVEKHVALPETLLAQTPTGGSHFVFKAPSGKMASPMNVREGIDILTEGRYIVAAPSMINEQPYQWIIQKPAAVCPQWVIDLANEGKAPKAPAQTDVALVIRELLPDGEERNEEWHVLCPFHDEQNPSFSVNLKEGVYHCFACSAKGTLVDLYAHVKSVTLAEARQALGQTPEYIVELNEKHAVVSVGGKGAILTETYDPSLQRNDIALSTPSDLKLLYGNQEVRVGKRMKPIVDVWLKHPDRRQYASIVFVPNREVPGYYNLWQGFAVEPQEGDCSLYLAHLKDNIAKGDQAIYDYVLSWMAHMIQRPDQRVGVSLVLRGKQGTGKGVLATQLGKLLGKHFVHISQQKQLLGNFNAHLKDALLVFADEAFWAGDKPSEGPLKALVTENQLAIEYKGKDVLPVKNHVHLIVASNHPWVVPAGPEERRFCILDVGEKHMQDAVYFQAIDKQMNNGGAEALLYMLQQYDLKGKNLRVFPQTDALLENKILSMDWVQKFWLDRLIQGKLDRHQQQWEPWVERKYLHDEYCEFVRELGQSRKASETELGRGLKKLVPGLQSVERRIEGKRTGVWEFPDLFTCRKAFEEAVNYPYPWDVETNERDSPRPPGP